MISMVHRLDNAKIEGSPVESVIGINIPTEKNQGNKSGRQTWKSQNEKIWCYQTCV